MVNAFLRFCNFLSWKRVWPLNWTNMNPKGCFEIGQMVLEKILKSSSMYFCYFHYFLSFRKHVTLNLNKLNFPSPKDALCQIWLKLAQRFRRFSNFVKVFFAVLQLSSLGKDSFGSPLYLLSQARNKTRK